MKFKHKTILKVFLFGFFVQFFPGASLAAPSPDIKANSSDGPITISTTDTLTLAVSLNATGNTGQADWWAIGQAPSGTMYSYNLSSKTFQPGTTVTYTGPLFDLPSYQILSMSGLPQGAYTFYFAVDLTPDGSPTTAAGQWYSDSVSVTVSSGGGPTGSSNWKFAQDNITYGISGVSPEAILLSDGSVRLYITDMGITVYRSSGGVSFSAEAATPPQGSDPTLIKLSDGTYRMYYVDQSGGAATIKTATSPDGLTWTTEGSTGISNTTGGQAWGVPDSIELPDGRIRLYWVDMVSGSNLEVIKSAISTDGVNFTEESGYRTTGGYVDPYIIQAQNGNWVGLFATTPVSSMLPQKIYMGTSTDGLTWTIESAPIITVSGGNALDPTAVPLGNGSFRVYYIATPGSDPFTGFSLASGVLSQ